MPTRPLKLPDTQRAVRLVESMLRKGYAPRSGPGAHARNKPQAIVAAGAEAKRLGWALSTKPEQWIRHRLRCADDLGIGVDWSIKPRRKPKPKAARVEFPRPPPIETIKTQTVFVIPDVHLCPTLQDVSRMEWLGRHAAAIEPDWIVQLGDLVTADSVNAHAPPGTIQFEKNPRIKADFEILERGLERFDRGLGKCRARRHQTKGNHEHRFDRFEDRNPQCQGMFVERFDAAMNKAGWGVSEFGKYFYIEGVGFIHIPMNPMGKPYGGKTAPTRIANDSVFSIVHGHCHTYASVPAAKFDGKQVRVISAGCALPQGHVEPYAKHSLVGWAWGALTITVRGGQIMDETWTSMDTLRRRYSGVSRSR